MSVSKIKWHVAYDIYLDRFIIRADMPMPNGDTSGSRLWIYGRELTSFRTNSLKMANAFKIDVDALRKDAERYRWIKKESNLSDYEDCYSLPMVHAWDYKPGPQLNEQFDSLDSAIDAAMGKEKASD